MVTTEQQRAELESIVGDKYAVLRKIGGGGMAQVFLARHRVHGGLFAIKVLAEHLAQDPRIVARFEQEARTAASLAGHPNIVPIFDIGQGSGTYFLIMQFVNGEDLGSYLRREGKLSPSDAANVIAQTAEGLLWSESKRVVHRDLKPANMLLDVTGRVLLLDFGISKIADLADGLTRPGESLGTPYYMSPEQIRGEGCDVRSDLYSLGVVFFELLTGARPFENELCSAVQIAHLSAPAPSVLSLDPTLPAACEDIIQKLMQKDRDHRYQSPKALLDEMLALGATSGPGSLRPLVDATLAAEMVHGTVTSLLDGEPSSALTQDRTPSRTPIKLDRVPHHPPPAATTDGPVPTAAAPQTTTRRKTWLVAWMVALLVVAAILGSVWFLGAAPPKVLEDAHGRMMLVPSGPFIFGDDSAGSPNPKQTITLDRYYVDETEVSNDDYKKFCEATGHTPPVSADYASHPELPIADVSLEDARAYAAWAGKRLPTEQEWEKAARGTDGRVYPWGSAPWTDDIPRVLQPVRSLESRKSPYGAQNMAGNVFEWTTARFPAGQREFADMQSVLNNSSFSREWYTIKGGSFAPHGETFFRAYMRRGFPSDQHSPWIGFRCVKDVPARGFVDRFQSLVSK